jgi:hypothetical protein
MFSFRVVVPFHFAGTTSCPSASRLNASPHRHRSALHDTSRRLNGSPHAPSPQLRHATPLVATTAQVATRLRYPSSPHRASNRFVPHLVGVSVRLVTVLVAVTARFASPHFSSPSHFMSQRYVSNLDALSLHALAQPSAPRHHRTRRRIRSHHRTSTRGTSRLLTTTPHLRVTPLRISPSRLCRAQPISSRRHFATNHDPRTQPSTPLRIAPPRFAAPQHSPSSPAISRPTTTRRDAIRRQPGRY